MRSRENSDRVLSLGVLSTLFWSQMPNSSSIQAIGKRLTPSQPDPACSFISDVFLSFPSLFSSFPRAAIYYFFFLPFGTQSMPLLLPHPLDDFLAMLPFQREVCSSTSTSVQAGRRGEVESHLNIFLYCVG